MSGRIGVMFVCLGNICRSPLAEAVFRDIVERKGLASRFTVDSSGTSNYHIGEQPDARTVEVAARRGLRIEHAGQQLTRVHLSQFDYVIAMDASNLGRIRRLATGEDVRSQVCLLRSFDPEAVEKDELEVPDPYFGGASGFEDVHDMVERACAGLLGHIRTEQHV